MSSQQSSAEQWEHRIDRGELLSPTLAPNGTLLVDGFASRVGVLQYRRADGSIRRELVTEECLKESAATMGRAPITLDHPDPRRYPDGVTPDNARELVVGDASETLTLMNGYVRLQLAVRRRDAIDSVTSAPGAKPRRELSAGYRALIDPRPGVDPVHGPYDCVQVRRVYNHIALVEAGRAGPEVGIRTDAAYSTETITGATTTAGGQQAGATSTQTTHAGDQPRGALMNPGFMPVMLSLGIAQQVNSDAAALDLIANKLRERNDAASTAEQQARASLSAMTAERDAQKARADAAEAELAKLKAADAARADAAERSGLEEVAKRIGVDPAKHTTAPALRKAIAQAHLGVSYRADADEAYDRAVVDIVRSSGTERSDARDRGTRAWEPPPRSERSDAGGPPAQRQPRRGPGAASRAAAQAAFSGGRTK